MYNMKLGLLMTPSQLAGAMPDATASLMWTTLPTLSVERIKHMHIDIGCFSRHHPFDDLIRSRLIEMGDYTPLGGYLLDIFDLLFGIDRTLLGVATRARSLYVERLRVRYIGMQDRLEWWMSLEESRSRAYLLNWMERVEQTGILTVCPYSVLMLKRHHAKSF